MTPIALLISENLLPGPDQRSDAFEYDEQMGKLIPAFAKLGLLLEPVLWKDLQYCAADYRLILPLMVWDYPYGPYETFLSAMEQAAKLTPIYNPPALIKWNSDKAYLEELYAKGAPVIPSQTIESVTEAKLLLAFDRFATDRLVIKPCIGAGAWRQFSLKRGEALPDPDQRPLGRALVQPFQNAIETEGEYSLLFFDGQFSHGLQKRPKAGDYRIQSSYGGWEAPYKPNSDMIKLAKEILTYLDDTPLYARIDLLRGNDGALKLIELELIEPYLYLPMAKDHATENIGAQALAASVFNRLSQL